MGLMANRCGRAVQLTLRCWRSHSTISSNVSHCGRSTDNFSWRSGYAIAAVGSILGAATCCFSEAHSEPLTTKITEKAALNPKEWVQFKLEETARVSHNTNIYRFSFDPDAKLGLHVASCIVTRAPIGTNNEGKRKYVIRPYTPISDPESKGYFDLLIKIYPEGKMSQHFAHLKPGDTLEVKGPIEKLPYSPNMKKHIGMVAGGTGITPMLQIVDAILNNPEDNTKGSFGSLAQHSKEGFDLRAGRFCWIHIIFKMFLRVTSLLFQAQSLIRGCYYFLLNDMCIFWI